MKGGGEAMVANPFASNSSIYTSFSCFFFFSRLSLWLKQVAEGKLQDIKKSHANPPPIWRAQ